MEKARCEGPARWRRGVAQRQAQEQVRRSQCRFALRVRDAVTGCLSSKKHVKVKTALVDETERRKHFYGIDAGIKKESKEGKKHGGDAARAKDSKKRAAK